MGRKEAPGHDASREGWAAALRQLRRLAELAAAPAPSPRARPPGPAPRVKLKIAKHGKRNR